MSKMNIDDLQQEWDQQFDGQESCKEIVVKLFQESRQSKVRNNLRWLAVHSLLFMLFNLLVIFFTSMVLVEEISNWPVVISCFILLGLSFAVFYMNVLQLGLIGKMDYSRPILELQQVVETLKVRRLRHNRFIFIFCNLYLWTSVIVFFRWDLTVLIPTVWQKAAIVVIVHVGMFLLWIPMTLWLLRKYDRVDGKSSFWAKLERESFLTDRSLNQSLNQSLAYLEEISAFRRENGNANA